MHPAAVLAEVVYNVLLKTALCVQFSLEYQKSPFNVCKSQENMYSLFVCVFAFVALK